MRNHKTCYSISVSIGVLTTYIPITACSTIPRDHFTKLQHDRSVIPGFEDVRSLVSDPLAVDKMRGAIARYERAQPGKPLSVLAISGGGANGAYGAGLLYAWTEAGGRPDFALVTGVSTGALIAPFAFLGSSWDPELKKAYTEGDAAKLTKSSKLHPLFHDSVLDGKPLRHLIDKYVTDDLIRAVAAEYARGRILLVATTDLDSEQLVAWNMGAIASRGGAAARQLFTTVMVASASIPGVFPPVMLPVTTAGRTIHEMHVDGTMINSFFSVPDAALLLREQQHGSPGKFYILINGKADEEFAVTTHALLPMVMRSYDASTKAAQRTQLTELAAFGQANGIAISVAAIPAASKASSLDFSTTAMQHLFALGEQRMSDGMGWNDLPKALSRNQKGGIAGGLGQ